MKTKNTGIRIETVKEVNDKGTIGYRVTSITALPKSQLPPTYLASSKRPVVSLDTAGDLCIENRDGSGFTVLWIKQDGFYEKNRMEQRLNCVAAAGQHLADVNRELAKERTDWNGPVVFIDGVAQQETASDEKPDPKPESVPARISRFWVAGNLYFMDDNGVIRPFLKPEIEI